jgi:DNA-binding transcriptional ArsR family regulator
MTAVFEVLAEESRRRILDLLAEDERPVGELVELLGLSQPAVSKHLKVLREAGLVQSRTDAQRRIYRVSPEPLRQVDEWLAPYRRRWSGDVGVEAGHRSALERHLEIMEESGGEPWA